LGCFYDDKEDEKHLKTVRALAGGECYFLPISKFKRLSSAVPSILSGQPISTGYFGSSGFAQWVRRILCSRPIDAALLYSSSMVPYLLDSDVLQSSRVILDMVDVDSDKWRQYAERTGQPMRWVYAREASTLASLEARAASRFAATLFVSREERSYFDAANPGLADRLHAIGNGVDLEAFAPGPYSSPFAQSELPIVMTGRMDYRANVDGACWFIEQVLPRVRERIPRSRFYAVGANPDPALNRLHGGDVVITGAVNDVRPYLQHAAVVVAPLRIARGLQNKVLEAFAMEKGVVATSSAVRAFKVERGRELWVEDEAWGFARAVRSAIQGNERYRVAKNARAYVEKNHQWSDMLSEFDQVLETVAHGHATGRIPLSSVPVGAPDSIAVGVAQ
jgi:sugar transferase (PEP-CTERM/EpsH1 system associated)